MNRYPAFIYKLFAGIAILFFTGCFEYDEVIRFNNNFEGSIDVTYIVPLKKNSNESMIRFLPTTKEEIESKVNKGLLAKKVKIRNFSFEVIPPSEETTTLFKKKGRVTYSVDFTEFSQMEPVILGSLFVRRKDNTIKIRREFKTMPSVEENVMSEGEKKIISETVRLLSEGFMNFRVEYPKYSECFSNKGDLTLGNLKYKIPLTDTIDKKGDLVWDYRITILY